MHIHRGLPQFKAGPRRILTTGTFDGVHLGHQALLSWMVDRAREQNAESVVLTFHPHPRQVLFGDNSGLSLLQSMDQRARELERCGLDHLVIQPFDRDFARLRPEEFVKTVLVEGLGCTTVVVGHDHRFGAGREGDVDLLRDCGETFGFDVVHIPAHIEDELTVSSTKVRQRLGDGDCTGAAALLGRPHAWAGQVIRGDGRGRTLGYPTANLSALEPQQLLPAAGVYAARIAGHESDAPSIWDGMVHIGNRPTFDAEDRPPTVEAHLFDADGPNLYGQNLEIQFIQRLRGTEKFDGADALQAQLNRDEMAARDALAHRNPSGLR